MTHLRLLALASATAVAFALPALALEETSGVPRSTNLSGLEANTYTLDPTHVILEFGVSHMGMSLYRGRFNTVEGSLAFKPDAPETSTLTVSIDTASLDIPSDTLAQKVLAADMLDAAGHPKATFVSTAVARTGETTGTLTGDLTIKGITKPVTLDVTFNGTAKNPFSDTNMLGFTATGSFKRSDFAMTNWAPAVGDTVVLRIDVEFLEPKE